MEKPTPQNDHTSTVVLPENDVASGRQIRHSVEREAATYPAFDDTLVLEDELAKRRRLRA